MRILTVTHFFESHGGGIERVASHLCRQFQRLGATSVWAASDGDPAPDGNINAVPLPCMNPIEKLTGLPMPIPGSRAVRTIAREVGRSDAVIVHDALYITSIVALLIAKMRRKRVILVQHVAAIPFSSPLLSGIMRVANVLVTRPMHFLADERVFISDTVRRELLGKQSGELLFNGVDSNIFHPAGDRTSLPETLAGIIPNDSARRMLFVGRYVEKKGLKVLRALAALRSDMRFVLVGRGPIQPSEWGLTNVHDIGPQNQKALSDLYRWADLLLLPSVGEGFPLVIQEAMASGLPVVCGAPSERADPDAAPWLRGVEINLVDPEGSARRCSAAIEGFEPSSAVRAQMAQYARSRYDWERMAERLMALAQSGRATASA